MNAPRISVLVMALILALAVGCAKEPVGTDTGAQPASAEQTTAQKDGAAGDAQQDGYTQAQIEEQRRKEQELKRRQKMAMDEIGEMIFFDYDSYEIKPQYRQILNQKAKALKALPNTKLVIEGHCDERGTEEYNLALGERRARAAYEYLVLLGVEPQRMSIVSYGEEQPLATGDNEAAWAKNRRAEFELR